MIHYNINLNNIKFDINYYKSTYPDLQHMTNEELTNHFIQYGFKEGRLFCNIITDFDFLKYLTDFKLSINTIEEIIKHFLYKFCLKNVNNNSQLLNYELKFNEYNYKKYNSDLIKLKNEELKKHFIEYGIKEKRKFLEVPNNFNFVYYLSNINKNFETLEELWQYYIYDDIKYKNQLNKLVDFLKTTILIEINEIINRSNPQSQIGTRQNQIGNRSTQQSQITKNTFNKIPKCAIIYVYYNRPNELKNETNLAFFIRQTVLKDTNNIYLFIINNNYTEVVFPQQNNLYILKNKNCYDIEAYGIGIRYLENLNLKFERLVLMNCGVTGPFYRSSNWLEPFENKIRQNNAHICSTLSYNFNNKSVNPGYFNYIVYNKNIKELLLTVLKNYKDKSSCIIYGEYGISNILIKNNYKVTSLINNKIPDHHGDRQNHLDKYSLSDLIYIKNVWKTTDGINRDSLPVKFKETINELNKISNFNAFSINNINYQLIKVPKSISWNSQQEYYNKYGISEEYIVYPKMSSLNSKLALYCHSDSDNLFRSFCIDAVNTLALLGYKVIILTTCNFFKNVKNLQYEIIKIPEALIDIYMIKKYLNINKINHYTHLLLANDSLIFPIHGFDNMKSTINKFSNIDFWGIWSSPESKEHIMCPFLHLSNKTFNAFINNLNKYDLKTFINAQLWEINLLEEMKNNNFTTASVIDYKSLGDLNELTCPIMHPTIFPKWIKNEEVFAIKWKYIGNYLNKQKLNLPYMNYLLRYLHFNHTGIKGKPEIEKTFDIPMKYLK